MGVGQEQVGTEALSAGFLIADGGGPVPMAPGTCLCAGVQSLSAAYSLSCVGPPYTPTSLIPGTSEAGPRARPSPPLLPPFSPGFQRLHLPRWVSLPRPGPLLPAFHSVRP